MEKIQFGRPLFGEEERKAVDDVMKTTWILNGPKVVEFENAFQKYLGSGYAATVTNCTAGMQLALQGLGVGKGDEVILPAFNFIAAGIAVLQTRATPVFVDIEPETCTIDPNKIKEKITNKTKAILVCHYAGHSADMDPIINIAKENNVYVVADAAHALGTEYKGKDIGLLGDAAVFSFGPLKMISCGMGSIISTPHKDLDAKIRVLRSYGMDKSMYDRRNSEKPWYYEIQELGHNFRMTDILAAIAIEQMKKLDKFIAKRREIAKKYNEAVSNSGLATPPIEKDSNHTYLYYAIRFESSEKRSEIMKKAKEHNIGVSVHWDPPLHVHPLFKEDNKIGDFPVSEDMANKILSLPMHPALTDEEVERVMGLFK